MGIYRGGKSHGAANPIKIFTTMFMHHMPKVMQKGQCEETSILQVMNSKKTNMKSLGNIGVVKSPGWKTHFVFGYGG